MFEPGLGSRVRLKGLALRVNNEGRTDFIVSISQDHQVLFALDLGSGQPPKASEALKFEAAPTAPPSKDAGAVSS